jgi:hypothetical protein
MEDIKHSEVPRRWDLACYWCGHDLTAVSDGDVSDPRFRDGLAAHLATCPQHPHRFVEAVTRRWKATGDPIRADCADEIETVCREVWLRPHFSERL